MMNTQANKIERNPNHSQRRWQRGNTLVPVVIGLAISAAATVGFLSQGQELAAKTKTVLASSEITGILSDWNLSEAANGDGFVGTAIPAMKVKNIYESTMTFNPAEVAKNTAILTYPTDDATSCGTLAAIFNDTIDGVHASECNGSSSTTLQITLTGSGAAPL